MIANKLKTELLSTSKLFPFASPSVIQETLGGHCHRPPYPSGRAGSAQTSPLCTLPTLRITQPTTLTSAPSTNSPQRASLHLNTNQKSD
uniref:Uncharacterized protein n=1 Tax=Anguilla anguilla TaxID=7936 RepID=A0A0E9XRU8_ANGAN